MLVAHETIKGPIPKITPHLVSSLREQGVEVDTEPWGRRSDTESLVTKAVGRLLDAWRVRRRLQGGAYDLLLVHTSHDLKGAARDLQMLIAARSVVPRIALHLHGSRPEILLGPGQPIFNLITRAAMRFVDGALVLSSEECVQWHRIYPAKRFHLIANPFVGSDSDEAKPALGSMEVSQIPSLLFVGRVMEPKGVLVLVEALRLVVNETPCRLVIAGTGPDDRRAHALVESLGLTDSVRFAGYVTGPALSALYRNATIFVLPSCREGFPTVISEAMDAGLPVITTRVGGLPDHLQDGVNARFVAPRDPRALAEAILRLLKGSDERIAMGLANRAKVREFAPGTVGPVYLRAIQDIIGEPRPPPSPQNPCFLARFARPEKTSVPGGRNTRC